MKTKIALFILMAVTMSGCISAINVTSVNGVPYTNEMQEIEPTISVKQQTLQLPEKAYELAFTGRDDQLMVTGGNYVELRDLPRTDAKTFKDYCTTASLSRDGKVLAMGGYVELNFGGVQDVSKLTFFDVKSGQKIGSYEDAVRPMDISFSNRDNQLAVVDGGDLSFVDPKTGKTKITLVRNNKGPIAFSSKQGQMAFTNLYPPKSGSYSVCLYDLNTGRPLHNFPTDKWIHSITFSKDAKLMAVVTNERRFSDNLGTVRIYDTASGAEVFVWQQPEGISKLQFSSDGNMVGLATVTYSSAGLSAAGALHVINLQTQKEETAILFDFPVGDMDFSPDNSLITATSAKLNLGGHAGLLLVYDLNAKTIRYRMDVKKLLSHTAFAPSGKFIAATAEDELHLLKIQ